MDIDWEAEWDTLSNDDVEARVAEKNLAQATQKTVREFPKSWDWYLPSFSTIPCLFADTSLRFNMEVLSKCYIRTSADTPSWVEPKDSYQVVHDFSLEVFSENGEARASSIFGLFVLQNIADGLPTGHNDSLESLHR